MFLLYYNNKHTVIKGIYTKMKKIFFSLLSLLLLSAILVSCSGVSVPYYILKLDNDTDNVLQKYAGVKETLIYYKDGEKEYSYSIYIERAEKAEYGYNVCESYNGYTFFGYEGEIYAVSEGKTFALIQADGSTYYEYILPYTSRTHYLDAGEKYQKYSKKNDSITEVAYYSKMTISDVAALGDYGIFEGDKIISLYILDKDNFYLGIEYSVEHYDGTTETLASRTFEYYTEKQNVFSSLPTLDDTVNINLIYNAGTMNEKTQTYIVPRGIYFGIDKGKSDISVYNDIDFTIPFDFENAVSDDDTVLYVKNNQQ